MSEKEKLSQEAPTTQPTNNNKPESCQISIHPWYYVPGNVHLTEQRLSKKYHKESDRYRKNEAINKYFM